MMAYQEGMVASIILDDKPVREYNLKGQRTCKIPFNSEYKIKLKNKTGLRSLVSIDIDGTDIFGFKKLILKPYQEIELERFIVELEQGPKFKFMSIEDGVKTGEIQDPTNKDNGIISIKFFKEMIPPTTNTITYTESAKLDYMCCQTNGSSTPTSGVSLRGISAASASAGATAEGSNSNQKFDDSEEWFPTEVQPLEVKIKLVGFKAQSYFGVFLDNSKKPSFTFADRMDAYNFVKVNDFGLTTAKIRPI